MRSDLPVGELFMLGFRGREIPEWLDEFAGRYGLGGVILFDYDCQTRKAENNIYSPDQVRELCAEIHALPGAPLIFVDQEGGRVRRLKEKLGFAPLPSALAFNRLAPDERLAVAERSFREMRALGIDYDLAPVIDLNLNPQNPDIGAHERSFSDRPDEVRACVRAVDEAARRVGLGLSLKHFPGLGGATVNSHEELTDISDSVIDAQLELFYELGATLSGGSVIVSHGIVRQWDPENPVSMSPAGLARIRARLPDAWLISDDLQMQGLQRKYPSERACLQGIDAGLDMVIVGNNMMAEDARTLDYAAAVSARAERDAAFRAKVETAIERCADRKERFGPK